ESLLRDFVYEQASVAAGEGLENSFEFLFALSQMERFFENEIERQKSGYSVHAAEKSVLGDIGGVTFDARVDRIDKQNGEFCVIDYKIVSKEIKADSEKAAADSYKYQLALYILLLQREGIDAKAAYYYDVLRGSLVLEGAMEAKLGSLEAHIERFLSKPQFLGAKDKKSCIYCDFKTLCGAGSDMPSEDGDDE
ncbi:MAG TPA: PD-(D/E)XK nuclease family protein, partial [Campylobacterales bacterium]|nr:PD-(D/E)XK nuclease family protein [Campylobacterales bacterium]